MPAKEALSTESPADQEAKSQPAPVVTIPDIRIDISEKPGDQPPASGQQSVQVIPEISLPGMDQRIELPPITAHLSNVNSELITRALKLERSFVYPETIMNRSQNEQDNEQPSRPIIMKDPELLETIRDLRDMMKKPLSANINYESMVKSTTTVRSIESDTKR